MSERPSTYIGLACAALVLASFVPGISDAANGTGLASEGPGLAKAALKGDMLSPHRLAARHEVASIRIQGEQVSVSMRTRAGILAYQADAAARLSVAAKNVVLPPISDRLPAPMLASQDVVVAPDPGSTNPTATKAELRKVPIGCERLVSVLVKTAERDRLGRCLA